MSKQRDISIDVAKGIAMLMVIRIHTEFFNLINFPYPVIAVPFFFFISGFYDISHKPIKQWLPKSLYSLVIPGIIWLIISFIYLSILHYIKEHNIDISFSIYDPIIANKVIWFLFALFYVKIFMWILHLLKLHIYIKLALVILIGIIGSYKDLPFLFDEGLSALPFYYIGKLYYPKYKDGQYNKIWLYVVGGVSLCMMSNTWFPYVLVPYNTSYGVLLYPIFFLMTLLSFSPILWISKKIGKQMGLYKYGKQTLGILVLHPLFLHSFYIILNRIFVFGSTPWIITSIFVYIIVCILCYFCTIWIIRLFPILLGKR